MRKSHASTTLPDRRRVVLAGGALLGVAALPNAPATATDAAGLAPAAEQVAATRKLLSSLDADQRKAAAFAWNRPEWTGWNDFGVGGEAQTELAARTTQQVCSACRRANASFQVRAMSCEVGMLFPQRGELPGRANG